MPHHPSEEEAPSHIYDKVARQSTDASTSDHPMHDENKTPISQATVNKGPVMQDSMPDAKTKEELQAKAKEMNK